MNSQSQNTPVYLQQMGKSQKSCGARKSGEFKVTAAATMEYGFEDDIRSQTMLCTTKTKNQIKHSLEDTSD